MTAKPITEVPEEVAIYNDPFIDRYTSKTTFKDFNSS